MNAIYNHVDQKKVCLERLLSEIEAVYRFDSVSTKELDALWPRLSKLEIIPHNGSRDHIGAARKICSLFLLLFMSEHADDIVTRFKLTANDVFCTSYCPHKTSRWVSHSVTIRLLVDAFSNTNADVELQHTAFLVLRYRGTNQEWLELYDECIKALPRNRRVAWYGFTNEQITHISKWSSFGIDPFCRTLTPSLWRDSNRDACNDVVKNLLSLFDEIVGHRLGPIVWSYLVKSYDFPSRPTLE